MHTTPPGSNGPGPAHDEYRAPSAEPGAFILPGFHRTFLLRLLPASGSTYTAEQAVVSLLLDVDAGRVKSQRAYGRIWCWTYGQLRYRWDDIWQDATRFACSNGRQLHGPARNAFVDKLPHEWQAWALAEYGDPEQRSQVRTERASISAKNGRAGTESPDSQRTNSALAAQAARTTAHTAYPISQEGEREARAHANTHDDAGQEVVDVHPAVATYADVAGVLPGKNQAEQIARRFPDPAPDDLTAWGAHVETWRDSPTRNVRNVKRIVETFDEHRPSAADVDRAAVAHDADRRAAEQAALLHEVEQEEEAARRAELLRAGFTPAQVDAFVIDADDLPVADDLTRARYAEALGVEYPPEAEQEAALAVRIARTFTAADLAALARFDVSGAEALVLLTEADVREMLPAWTGRFAPEAVGPLVPC